MASTPDYEGYRAAIQAVEDRWYDEYRRGTREAPQFNTKPPFHISWWHFVQKQLFDIETRHGIGPSDLTIHSVAAYKQELSSLQEWIERELLAIDTSGRPQESLSKQAVLHQFALRQFDAKARAFSCDSLRAPAAVWSRIKHEILSDCPTITAQCSFPPEARGVTNEEVRGIYRMMRWLKIPWTRVPPYPTFAPEEAVDELMGIADRIEAEEGMPASQQACRAGAQSAGPPLVATPTEQATLNGLSRRKRQILELLDGKVMTGQELASNVGLKCVSQLHTSHLAPLLRTGSLKNVTGRGYFRPDRPPPGWSSDGPPQKSD
jgi:hypothetical protein